MENFKFDLQIFADAGTVVNATGGYVNSGTGEATGFTDSKTLSPELKAFYDTELLENARTEMFYAQFAKRQPLPANHHGSVEWRKWNTFDRAAKLKEGVIPTGQKFGVTTVTGAVDQYGTYTSITDKLELRAYDDVILGATEEMGASAAETQEKLIRDALLMGTNVLYCDNIDKDTGKVLSTPESCAQMGAIEIGEDNSGTAVSAGKAKLLLTAADASENALRHAERFTQGRRVITVPLHYTREELGKALGIGGCSMAAVTDIGFANALMKALSEQKPDMYAQAAETVGQRQAKAARRKKETAALKGGRRNDKRRTGA